MKPVQIYVHICSESEIKFKQLRSWDALLQETVHSAGYGDYYSNTYYDKDTQEGVMDFKSALEYINGILAENSIVGYVEESQCEVEPILM